MVLPAVRVQGEGVGLLPGAADDCLQLAGGEGLDHGEGKQVEEAVARGCELLADGGAGVGLRSM